jgi:pimeloyl-ACP methyl ester carboxylesterase
MVLDAGPPDADRTVLLVPGALCTAAFFEDVMAERKLSEASIRLVATTLQGYGARHRLAILVSRATPSWRASSRLTLAATAVVGHSVGANVAIEMAAAGGFSGPLALLAASFSRKDESMFPRVLDRLGMVFGHLPFAAMLRIIGAAMKSSLPAGRRDALIAEMKKNDPRLVRRQLRQHLAYLDRHGSLVARLCDSAVKAWVVFGERDDVGLTDEERRGLEQCPAVTLITIADAGHFTMNSEPSRIGDVIREMVSS